MNLGQFTEPKLLIPRLLSDRQDGTIKELAARLESCGRIQSAATFSEAVLRRDAQLPAFLDGVALPHGRGAAVRQLSVAVGLSTVGIAWRTSRGRSLAHAVFLFAVPLTGTQAYLSLLAGLSSLMQDRLALAALMRAVRPEEMLKVLQAVRLGHEDRRTEAAPALVQSDRA